MFRTMRWPLFVFACSVALLTPASADDPESHWPAVAGFLDRHCVACHGPDQAEAGLRLDRLTGKLPHEATHWRRVAERIVSGDMPPADRPQPRRAEVARAVARLDHAFRRAGFDLHGGEAAFPAKANALPHEWLFPPPGEKTPQPKTASAPATSARIWRVSPYQYRQSIDELTRGFVGVLRGKVGGRGTPLVAAPFGLTGDAGFRDYAFRYRVAASEIEQLALNARTTMERALVRNGRYPAPDELTDVAGTEDEPTGEQLDAALDYVFTKALRRPPTEEERKRYTGFLRKNVERLGNREGLILGLSAVLLHPEAVFRLELGRGEPDENGRVMLAPLELAHAISFALTDRRPDATLLAAARRGRLQSPSDVRREVDRLFDDPDVEKPRMLRFFREFFGYAAAPAVFKDDSVIKAAGFRKYYPERLVEDTDRLVLHVLEEDRHVLRKLLTTHESFVSVSVVPNWLKFEERRAKKAREKGEEPPTHPFDEKNKLHEHYGLDPEDWSVEMPLPLDRGQRAGILTQPAWLVAHSTNTHNHAVLRGKWIRERLLGGHLPDTPITVDAQLPDEPESTLRHRMRVTREDYCWTCHQRMDPLGLPFEMFDHFGRFRTEEQGRPVDTTGAVLDSVPELEGPVENAVELVHRLAESDRVRQVFVRHAFRYWIGRNETVSDAPVLQSADAAYVESEGSMRALVTALLTSDAFLYRTVPNNTPTDAPDEEPEE